MDFLLRFPLNRAHYHERQAESKESLGLLDAALDARKLAVENYELAIKDSSNKLVIENIKIQIQMEKKRTKKLENKIKLKETNPKFEEKADADDSLNTLNENVKPDICKQTKGTIEDEHNSPSLSRVPQFDQCCAALNSGWGPSHIDDLLPLPIDDLTPSPAWCRVAMPDQPVSEYSHNKET